VLLNTLVYRVEQVFLIERESGLLLLHVKAGAVSTKDADMVSGMLSAIRDFVRDSFRVSEHEALDTLQVGELSVWIEQGPHAMLAAVIRGNAPTELRHTMQEAIEHVHARMGGALADFSGDTDSFETVRPVLENCLEARYRTDQKKVSPLLWVLSGAIVLALILAAYFSLSSRAKWNAYVSALRAEPGIVVVSTERRDGRYAVSGLRDPLARDPASLVAASGLADEDVTGQWQLYQALEPPLVIARARRLLRAPESVSLTLTDGVLTAGGSAPVEWIQESLRLGPLVPGVASFDAAALVEGHVSIIGQELSRSPLLFVRGSNAMEIGSDQLFAAHLRRLRQVDALAQLSDRRYVVEIVGHADGDGSADVNESLSESRARLVRSAVEGLRLSHIGVEARWVGSREPASRNLTDDDKRLNRRVSLRILPAP
jgi:OOP family OmpA-OmpF porin